MTILLNYFFMLGFRGTNSETSKCQPLALHKYKLHFYGLALTSGLNFAKIQKNYIILNAQTYIFIFRGCILTNSYGILSGNCLNLEKINEKD